METTRSTVPALAALIVVGSATCAPPDRAQTTDTGGQAGGPGTTTETLTIAGTGNKVDLLFVVGDSAAMAPVQQKLMLQLPPLLESIEKQVNGPFSLHAAVVSADMGAPGDAGVCTPTGDAGEFRAAATGKCQSTTLAGGATFLSMDYVNANFTDSPETVLQCVSSLGSQGCGFSQPLAALEHALGADNVVNGSPTPPASNAGFLRSDA